MICNPVIAGGGSEKKKYKVTDDYGYMLTGEYYAGEIVKSGSIAPSIEDPIVKAKDGTTIPTGAFDSSYVFMFIMPAQDVTIS